VAGKEVAESAITEGGMAKDDPGKPRGVEPQSYGSDADWLSGHTGQTVEETPQSADRTDEEFYESRHDDRSSTSESPAGRSPVEKELEHEETPDPGSAPGEDIPRKPV
jgi:hypothetical protein